MSDPMGILLYFDSQSLESNTSYIPNTPTQMASTIFASLDHSDAEAGYSGYMDELCIWNRLLTDEEAMLIPYTSCHLPHLQNDLQLHYSFDNDNLTNYVQVQCCALIIVHTISSLCIGS